jgi:hypothetical protein
VEENQIDAKPRVVDRQATLTAHKRKIVTEYLNYAREHWMKAGENPPVGLILCAEKGAAEAHYALDNLPNKVLAAEYQMVLPDEATIVRDLERTRKELERRGRETE